MKRIIHKASAVSLLMAMCMVLAMLSVLPVTAAGFEPTAGVSADEVTLGEDGSFAFEITLSASSAFVGTDIGVACSDGVTIDKVTATGGVSVSGPTERGGLIWFGFFTKEITSSTFTVSGKCTADEGTVRLEKIDVYPDLKTTVSAENRAAVTLKKQSEVPETTTTVPATTPATPETTTTAPAATAPVTSSNNGTGENPAVPTTGDMNAPILQISCAVIALIAASALIYITHRNKIAKGE